MASYQHGNNPPHMPNPYFEPPPNQFPSQYQPHTAPYYQYDALQPSASASNLHAPHNTLQTYNKTPSPAPHIPQVHPDTLPPHSRPHMLSPATDRPDSSHPTPPTSQRRRHRRPNQPIPLLYNARSRQRALLPLQQTTAQTLLRSNRATNRQHPLPQPHDLEH